MKCYEIMECLEEVSPKSFAESWDNVGLLCGREEKEVSAIYIALDATKEVIEGAKAAGADMLLTHHPMIFHPLKRVAGSHFIGDKILTLAESGMCYYAMHTNFDGAPGGMADLAAERLGLKDTAPLEVLGQWPDTGLPYGIGVCGDMRDPLTLEETALLVKEKFGLPCVNVYGAGQIQGRLWRAAICPGSGKGMAEKALALGAQVLITGDIGHHEGIDGVARGLGIVDGGHYGLEHIFMDFMESYIKEKIDSQLTIIKAPPAYPVTTL